MSYPFVPARWHGGPQSTITRIVMHGTVSPTVVGGALNVAHFFQTETNETSAHFVVDPATIIQCVAENTIAWHDGTNTDSIGVELCDPVDGPADRWEDAPHMAMLGTAARLVLDVATRHNVPLVHLTPAQIRAGERGLCGHVDMRDAFPGSTTHYDPGPDFPWTTFLDLLHGTAPVVPTIATEDDTVIILCGGKPDDPTTWNYATLTGFNFVGLGTAGEKSAAHDAMNRGVAYMWVDQATWNEYDRRSHVVLGDIKPGDAWPPAA